MAHLPVDTAADYCEMCMASPARQGKTHCDECLVGVFFLFCRGVGAAAGRLAPEAWALLVILFLVPTLGYWAFLLLIPVLCVAARHGAAVYRRQIGTEIDAFLYRSFPVWEAQQYISGIQQGKAQIRAELRREIVARGYRFQVSWRKRCVVNAV